MNQSIVSNYEGVTYKDNYVKFLEDLQTIERRSVLSKTSMGKEICVDYNDIEKGLKNGRYTITVEEVPFKCFINLSTDAYLYVFLSGAVVNESIFQRWSWNAFGNTIAIADPMTTEHGIALGWYYGTREKDYRHLASKIVKKIARMINIPNEKIVIYGSSGGGTSAVYLSSNVVGSTCVSINPQIDVHSLKNSCKHIEQVMGFSIDESALKYRNEMKAEILKSPKNKFIFLVNCLSKEDMIAICDLSYQFDLKIEFGKNIKDNLCVWIYKAKPMISSSGDWAPHNSQDYLALFQCIDFLIRSNSIFDERLIEMALAITKMWQDHFDLLNESLKLKTILDSPTDIKAQFRLAKMYLVGDHVEKNKQKYIEMIQQCSERNCFPAKEELKKINREMQQEKEMAQIAFKKALSYKENNVPDYNLAIKYMKNAYDLKHPWAKKELLYLLWAESSDQSLKQYREICEKEMKSEDYECALFLSRMYSKGKGVNPDLNRAKQLLRIAIAHDVYWAYCELFDILWQDNTLDSNDELIDLAEQRALVGDPYMIGRLARAYWKGKGVDKNLIKAKYLMMYACDKKIPWAIKEYALIKKELNS